MEVQIKITTACTGISNPYYHTKQPRFIRLIFFIFLSTVTTVSVSVNKYSVVQVQKTCKAKVLTHFHILFVICLYFFFFFQASMFAVEYADLQCILF